MRSGLIIAAVLVVLVAGTVVHLQANAGASSSAMPTKTEPVPVYLMGAAQVPGFNDTQWRTSLEVCNFGGVGRSYGLHFLHRGQSNPEPEAVEFTLAPGLCANYPDAVASVFGLDEAVGTNRLVADGDGIVTVARTYNDTPDGTYGTALGAIPVEEAVLEGASMVLVHLAQSASDNIGYRTNLDLLNVTELEIEVEVALYGSAGNHYGTRTTTLLPFEYQQMMRVFRQVTSSDVDDGYAVVRTTTVGGALMAAASLVDNRTGDTTTIAGSSVPMSERWLEPENMGEAINSAGDDWYPVPARDGSYMVFVSKGRGGYGFGDLYISRFVDGAWQQAENLGPNVNTSGFETAPFLSADGQTLYFSTNFQSNNGNLNIWSCPMVDGVAGPRTRLPSPINGSAHDCCPVVSPDGTTMYLCSDRSGGSGDLDVWVAQRVGGEWQAPVNLGEAVNSALIDCPRWLSDDGLNLIVASNRYGRIGGADLWSVVRSGAEWLAPVNLGAPINSRSDEWGPGFVGNDGGIAGRIYFGSGRPGGHGGWDIWYADLGYPIAGGVASSGSVTVRIPAVTADAKRAEASSTVEPAPIGRGCCSSTTSQR